MFPNNEPRTQGKQNPYYRKCVKRACKGWMVTVLARYGLSKQTYSEFECMECGFILSPFKKARFYKNEPPVNKPNRNKRSKFSNRR